jgi:hypothetical protein
MSDATKEGVRRLCELYIIFFPARTMNERISKKIAKHLHHKVSFRLWGGVRTAKQTNDS